MGEWQSVTPIGEVIAANILAWLAVILALLWMVDIVVRLVKRVIKRIRNGI